VTPFGFFYPIFGLGTLERIYSKVFGAHFFWGQFFSLGTFEGPLWSRAHFKDLFVFFLLKKTPLSQGILKRPLKL
jgi:hypothetical protein